MFWYLSFLRPPPSAVVISSPGITITPQIANDLRTELRTESSTDIYHVWQCTNGPAVGLTINCGKLTTYDPPVNTYKPLTIPLPARARVGDAWRLGLYAPPATHPDGTLPLQDDAVIGVWSEPIKTVASDAKGKGKDALAGKQTRISRSWRLGPGHSGENKHDILTIIEQTSFDLDKKIWDSGLALSSYLASHLWSPASSQHPPSRHRLLRRLRGDDKSCKSSQTRVVEIGAGSGLVSIALAALLARGDRHVVTRPSAFDVHPTYHILTTDLESAIPLINENLALNNHLWSSSRVDADRDAQQEERRDGQTSGQPEIVVKPAVLDWDVKIPDFVWRDDDTQADEAGIDVVVAADVTYNTSSFPSLIRTLLTLLTPRSGSAPPSSPTLPSGTATGTAAAAGTTHKPLLLLAYKQRDPAERELWSLLADELRLELVDVVKGHESVCGVEVEDGGEGSVEIWLGEMR